jgi:hypothetical protein
MFSTIQPGERPNDSSTALEGKRLLGRTKTGSKRFAFSDSFPPEKQQLLSSGLRRVRVLVSFAVWLGRKARRRGQESQHGMWADRPSNNR